mgnify:FL=1
MSKIFALVVLLNAVWLMPDAVAQMVLQADMAVLQPQISRDSVGFNRCGIRAVVSLFNLQEKSAENYDFTVMFDVKRSYAAMKAGKNSRRYDPVQRKYGDPSVTLPSPYVFWIADELDGKPAFMGKYSASPDRGYILGLGEFVPAFKAMQAMMDGRRVQFVMRYKSEKLDHVISFKAKLPPEELAPLEKCFADLIERMKNDASEVQK